MSGLEIIKKLENKFNYENRRLTRDEYFNDVDRRIISVLKEKVLPNMNHDDIITILEQQVEKDICIQLGCSSRSVESEIRRTKILLQSC